MPGAPRDGVAVIDKPAGWTSHDVVARCRRVFDTRKVGHAGTLDPMATGVLVLGVGRATRLLTYIVGADKDYDATVRLGQTTVTDDAEGEVTAQADASGVTTEQVAAAIAQLAGDIQQVPSAVSAIKVDGKRSYARVRGGEEVELAARPVTVEWLSVGALRPAPDAPGAADLDVSVRVSSGTYVRALARDLGAALGVGGHLTALRRTRVGGFSLDGATPLDELISATDAGEQAPLQGMAAAAAAALPTVSLDEPAARALAYGQRPPVPAGTPTDTDLAALDPDGQLVAIVRVARDSLRPVTVFQGPPQ